MPQDPEAAIAKLITDVNSLGRDNQWDTAGLRESVREFLELLNEEAVRFPQALTEPQWDLHAIDQDRSDAAFVVIVVSPERVALLAGRGPWEAVRDHGDNAVVADAFAVIAETRRVFERTGTPVELSRAQFDRWLAGAES